MKEHNYGLVLGKFYPFHLGHKHLIDTAIEKCEFLYVLVCTLPSETIDGTIRHQWIKETYKNNQNVEVIHINKELPQYPEDCNSEEEFYDIWCNVVYDNVEVLDCIFTSEDYGDTFAKYLGIDHYLVDKERKTFPISGTKIRNNVLENWNFLTNNSKKYFTKRIAILGTESTGKSTMVKLLSEYFNTGYIEEYGREYTNIYGTENLDVNDFEKIIMGQNNLLSKKLQENHKLLFCDTESITTKVFGKLYVKDFESDFIDYSCQYQEYDLYLLLDNDVEFINDGTREFENQRNIHLEMIKKELEYYNKSYQIISANGDYNKRLKKAIQVIEKQFNM